MTWLKLLIRKFRTLKYLNPREKLLFLQALVLFPCVAVILHLRGLRVTQKLLERLPHQPVPEPDQVEFQVWTTVRQVRRAGKYNRPWANCMKRSLVLWALLKAQGISSSIRIGVDRQSKKFLAHAWVEWQNMVLNDAEDVHEQYSAFEYQFTNPIQVERSRQHLDKTVRNR